MVTFPKKGPYALKFSSQRVNLSISWLKRFTFLFITVILLSAAKEARLPVIWILGDSTATGKQAKIDKIWPQMGWGYKLQSFFDESKVKVENEAYSGRSSCSYIGQIWPNFKNKIEKGDILIVQFGHNDRNAGAMDGCLSTYVEHALKVGALPIMTTPIEKGYFNKDGTHKLSHGEKPEATRRVSKKYDVPLVDLQKMTHEYFNQVGKDSTEKLFTHFKPGEFPNWPKGRDDNVHLCLAGAIVMCELWTKDLAKQSLKPVCEWLKDGGCNEGAVSNRIASKQGATRKLASYNSATKTLTIGADMGQNVWVNVLTLDGKSVVSKRFSTSTGNTAAEMALHALSSGTYIVRAQSSGTARGQIIHITR